MTLQEIQQKKKIANIATLATQDKLLKLLNMSFNNPKQMIKINYC